MNPLLIALLVGSIVSSLGTWKVTSYYYQAEAAKEVAAAIASKDAAESRADEIAGKFEDKLTKLKVINRTITNEVQRETLKPAYDCLLPADGARLLNVARTNQIEATAKPSGEVSGLGSGITIKPR